MTIRFASLIESRRFIFEFRVNFGQNSASLSRAVAAEHLRESKKEKVGRERDEEEISN